MQALGEVVLSWGLPCLEKHIEVSTAAKLEENCLSRHCKLRVQQEVCRGLWRNPRVFPDTGREETPGVLAPAVPRHVMGRKITLAQHANLDSSVFCPT